MPQVKLNGIELMIGAFVGASRKVGSRKSGLTDGMRAGKDKAWDIDIEGSLGEIAVAKYLNCYWQGGVNTFKKQDIVGYQVRRTQYIPASLRGQTNDKDDDIFILVTGTSPNFNIVGWAYGRDIKQKKYWNNGLRWYLMPEESLQPMETLPRRTK